MPDEVGDRAAADHRPSWSSTTTPAPPRSAASCWRSPSCCCSSSTCCRPGARRRRRCAMSRRKRPPAGADSVVPEPCRRADRADRRRRGCSSRCSCCCRWSSSSPRPSPRASAPISARLPRPRRARRDPADPDRGAIAVPLNARLRPRRRLGDRQVRVPRQEPAAHPDRPAVLGVAGDLGPGLRAAVRRPGLVRPLAARRTTSRSSSPCRASCWRRSS